MSISTDAILVFGIEIPDECPLIDKMNEIDTWNEYNSGDPCCKDYDDIDPKVGHMNDDRPLKLVQHCSMSEPLWILGLSDPYWTANRGYPVKVGETFIAQAEVNLLEAKFKELTGQDGKASWLLCVDTEL